MIKIDLIKYLNFIFVNKKAKKISLFAQPSKNLKQMIKKTTK